MPNTMQEARCRRSGYMAKAFRKMAASFARCCSKASTPTRKAAWLSTACSPTWQARGAAVSITVLPNLPETPSRPRRYSFPPTCSHSPICRPPIGHRGPKAVYWIALAPTAWCPRSSSPTLPTNTGDGPPRSSTRFQMARRMPPSLPR